MAIDCKFIWVMVNLEVILIDCVVSMPYDMTHFAQSLGIVVLRVRLRRRLHQYLRTQRHERSTKQYVFNKPYTPPISLRKILLRNGTLNSLLPKTFLS